MTATARGVCLVCGGTSVDPLISIPNVPTLCNRLCASEAEARNAAHGDIDLVYCRDCGHIVNAAFDQALVNYDGRFDNTLTFSPRYRQYADATSERLINRYSLSGKRIVEIGCGNGDFLHLLCAGGNDGKGYDPSQPTSGSADVGLGSVEIIGREFTVEDARGADFVCCRHVLEHLSEPMSLLRELYKGVAIRDGSIVFFEVPNALFTLERLGIWDIIYEHVSYFTPFSFVEAFRCAGFKVCCAGSAFDDQFLWLEGRADGHTPTIRPPPSPPSDTLYSSFRDRFNQKVAQWRRRIDELRSAGRHVVIWGGGAKGVMFLNLLRVTAGEGIDVVVDINPRKHGHFVPLMGQKIAGPDRLLQEPADLVIVMNPEYESEVRSMINQIGLSCDVVSA
jgi:SAM-dependent methyltransferase